MAVEGHHEALGLVLDLLLQQEPSADRSMNLLNSGTSETLTLRHYSNREIAVRLIRICVR